MKVLNLLFSATLLVCGACSATAQDTTKTKEEHDPRVFTKVEHPAEYPGGAEAWKTYLEQNLIYPEKAVKKKTEGVVRIQMKVDKEGNTTEIVALNNPGDGLAAEAIRLVKAVPKWTPAVQNGKKVIYRHILSILFKLN